MPGQVGGVGVVSSGVVGSGVVLITSAGSGWMGGGSAATTGFTRFGSRRGCAFGGSGGASTTWAVTTR